MFEANASQEALEPPPPALVANDDAPVPLHPGRPAAFAGAQRPLLVAGAVSILWLLIIAAVVRGQLDGKAADAGFGFAEWSLVVHGAIGPILFFFVLAMLIARNNDVRRLTQSVLALAEQAAADRKMPPPSPTWSLESGKRDVAGMADGVERAIARVSELQTVVRSEITWIERACSESEARLRGVIDDLSAQRSEIVRSADLLRQSVASAREASSLEFETAGEHLAESIRQAAEKANAALLQRGEHITATLVQTSDKITDTITLRSNDMLERLNIASIEMGEGLSGLAAEISTTLDERSGALLAKFESTGGQITGSLQASGEAFARRIGETGAALESEIGARVAEAEKVLSASRTAITSSIESQGMALADAIARQNAALSKTIAGDGKALTDEIAAQASLARTSLSGAIDLSRSAVASAADDLAASLAEQTGMLRAALHEQSAAAHEALVASTQALSSRIEAQAERLQTATAQAGEKLVAGLDERETSLAARLNTGAQTLETLLDAHASRMENTLSGRAAAFGDMFSGGAQQIEASLTARFTAFEKLVLGDGAAMVDRLSFSAEQLGNSLWDQFGRAERLINEDGVQLLARIETWHQQIDQTVAERSALANAALEAGARLARETVMREFGAFDDLAASRGAEIASALQEISTNLDSGLAQRVSELNHSLIDRSIEISRILDDGAREASVRIGQQSEAFAENIIARSDAAALRIAEKSTLVTEALSGRAQAMTESLDQRVARFEERVVGRLERLSLTLDERGHDIVGNLQAQIESVSKALVGHSEDLRRLFSSERQNMATAYGSTSDLVQKSVNTLIGQLADASRMTDQMVSTARSNLEEIEGALRRGALEAAVQFREALVEAGPAVTMVNAGTENLRKTMTASLSASQNMSVKLAENVRTLSEASASTIEKLASTLGELQDFEKRLSDLMTKRGEQIEASLKQATLQSKEFGYIGRTFAGTVEQTLASAEKRARQIGSLLVESAEASAQTASSSIQEVVKSATRQAERLAAPPAAAAPSPPAASPGENHVFAEAAQQFQAAVLEMRSMNAAIQSEIAARQAGAPGQADMAGKRGATGPSTINSSLQGDLASQMQRLPELTRSPAAEPRQGQFAGSHRATQDDGDISGGYLALSNGASPRQNHDDLLRFMRRKLQSEQPARMRPDETFMDSIERAVDHDAVVEFWQHYDQDDANVATHALYTPKGRETYDDVRRRYRREAEFRETVDRYIEEFEKLLVMVARREGGTQGNIAYLTSRSGKIYTLLADASGRFD